MKKFFVVILAVLYICSCSGVTLHMHYCMGNLAGWGLGHNNSQTCGKCGMVKNNEKDNGCCRDEHKFIKITTDQKITQSGFQLVQLIADAPPISFVEMLTYDFHSVSEENPISHAPPRNGGIAVYVRNCVFLI